MSYVAASGPPGSQLNTVIGNPAGWGRQRLEDWIETKYHQPSDEYSDDWDLRGAVADVRLLFYTGWQAAQQHELPKWTPGDEFEAARQAALDARR